jgi:histidinol-phosphatase (PHP family)
MTDFHTHSSFSGDGVDPLEDMVKSAIRMGCKYLAATEHCNIDFDYNRIPVEPDDLDGYAAEFARLREKYAGQIKLTFGIEFGFDRNCGEKYVQLLQKHNFEYVINSVHLIDGEDCYHGYFERYDFKTAVENYARAVRRSLDAPYRFDTVGHFGYIARNCSRPDADMYAAAPDLVDDVLKTIVARDICLEANSAVARAPQPVLPGASVLKRYRELGGESVVFGSDAHCARDLLRSRPAAMAHLRALGFKWHTVFTGGRKERLRIEEK